MKKRQESNQEGLEMEQLSLLRQASPVRSVPLIERLSDARQLVPLTARNQRRMPHVSIILMARVIFRMLSILCWVRASRCLLAPTAT